MIKQSEDVYTWRAVYHDEQTCITENAHNSFADVDQSRVKVVLLLPLAGGSSHRIDIPQDAQAVFFRRRSIALNPNTDEQQARPTVHCIGWKRDTETVYLFVMSDGSTLLTNDLQAV